MGDQEALEDMRSKIMASMADGSQQQPVKRTASESARQESENKRQRPIELPRGPRNGGNSVARSRYESHPRRPAAQNGYRGDDYRYSSYHRSPSPRYMSPQQPARARSRYTAHQGSRPSGQIQEDSLKGVEPIDKRKRRRPTRWDVKPKGFEKVPAERAKLSGLFPQPGEPQELDRSKLERVAMHGGAKSRRTRILFEDATSKNLLVSRLSCELIVENLEANVSISDFLHSFARGLGEDMNIRNISRPENALYAVVEFNNAECATIVLSCRSFINQHLGIPHAMWRRPNEYVQQLDHTDRLCSPEIIAVEGLKEEDEVAIQKLLSDGGVKTCYVRPIYCPTGESKLFTGCALVELDDVEDAALEAFQGATWFKPNEGALVQDSSLITFQSLPKLVSEPKRSESKVLVLLNCVDPLDLKLMPFAKEIEDTLRYTLEEVDTVLIKKPNVDYRLNFEHISEGVGNIYVKFNTLEASVSAMKKLPGSKFNGRAVLCSYVNEDDFERVGLL